MIFTSGKSYSRQWNNREILYDFSHLLIKHKKQYTFTYVLLNVVQYTVRRKRAVDRFFVFPRLHIHSFPMWRQLVGRNRTIVQCNVKTIWLRVDRWYRRHSNTCFLRNSITSRYRGKREKKYMLESYIDVPNYFLFIYVL